MIHTLLKFVLSIAGLMTRVSVELMAGLLKVIGKGLAQVIADFYFLFLVRRAAGGRTPHRAPGRSSSRHHQKRDQRRKHHP